MRRRAAATIRVKPLESHSKDSCGLDVVGSRLGRSWRSAVEVHN
jgi:hypothetical protein